MKINDCEILLEGSMTTDELTAYYNRAVDKYGRTPIRMTVRVEGDEVRWATRSCPCRLSASGALQGTCKQQRIGITQSSTNWLTA